MTADPTILSQDIHSLTVGVLANVIFSSITIAKTYLLQSVSSFKDRQEVASALSSNAVLKKALEEDVAVIVQLTIEQADAPVCNLPSFLSSTEFQNFVQELFHHEVTRQNDQRTQIAIERRLLRDLSTYLQESPEKLTEIRDRLAILVRNSVNKVLDMAADGPLAIHVRRSKPTHSLSKNRDHVF